jgi:hypothetical protein
MSEVTLLVIISIESTFWVGNMSCGTYRWVGTHEPRHFPKPPKVDVRLIATPSVRTATVRSRTVTDEHSIR